MQWGEAARRRGAIAATAALVAALAVGGFFGHRAYAAHQAAEAGCARVEQWKHDTSPYMTISNGPTTTAILGDSYSAGDDLNDRHDGWVYHYAAATGEQVVVNSVGYTGYLAGGYCGDDQFRTRLGAIMTAHPDRLILQGGLNDVGQDPADVSDAAVQLIDSVDDDVEVVVVGPPHAPQRSSGEKAIDRALQKAADQMHVQYLPAYGWDLKYNDGGLHLTESGHATFAERIAQAVS